MLADFGCMRATRMEFATLGRIRRGRNIARKQYPFRFFVGIGVGYCRKQRLSIGVHGVFEYFFFSAEFDHRAEVHYAYFIRNKPYYGQIVRNEQVSKSPFLLQLFKQVDNLRLNGNVKRGNGLVADYEFGINRQRARYTDTLTLTARKFVRVSLVIIIAESATFHKF